MCILSNGLAATFWGILLVAALLLAPTGAESTRWTIWLALFYYPVAVAQMLTLEGDDWRAATPRGRRARWYWTLAWITYVIHVLLAFHHFHHWSHEEAVRYTREQSGFGEGIWFSHLFTLAWAIDLGCWWIRPNLYACRSPWLGLVLHGFMLFMVFNATCVFGVGLVRWGGAALFVILGLLWIHSFAAFRNKVLVSTSAQTRTD
jgi:hypothetical protein